MLVHLVWFVSYIFIFFLWESMGCDPLWWGQGPCGKTPGVFLSKNTGGRSSALWTNNTSVGCSCSLKWLGPFGFVSDRHRSTRGPNWGGFGWYYLVEILHLGGLVGIFWQNKIWMVWVWSLECDLCNSIALVVWFVGLVEAHSALPRKVLSLYPIQTWDEKTNHRRCFARVFLAPGNSVTNLGKCYTSL